MKFREYVLNEEMGTRNAGLEYFEKDGKQMIRIVIEPEGSKASSFVVSEEDFKKKFPTWQKGIDTLTTEQAKQLETLKKEDAGSADVRMSAKGDKSVVNKIGDDKKV
jgi:hypothetical protein